MFHGWFQCPFVDDSSQDIPGHPGPILPTDPTQEKVSVSSPTPHATGHLENAGRWTEVSPDVSCTHVQSCTLYTNDKYYLYSYIYMVNFMDLMHISCRGI